MMLLLKNFSSFNLRLGKQSVFISQGCKLNTWDVEAPTVDPAVLCKPSGGLSSDPDVKYKTFLVP